jgi:putative transposase
VTCSNGCVGRELAPRLESFNYTGRHRYFLTICTHRRAAVFTYGPIVTTVLLHFRKCAANQQFANHAYCFMPDHVHLAIEGQSRESDLRELIRWWKSKTGFEYKRATDERLWQRGFYDHVIRTDEDAAAAAMYILENPVRAELVHEPSDYPYLGSDTKSIKEILRRGAEVRRSRTG